MPENQLLQSKFENFQKAISRQEGAYVPNGISAGGGVISYAGKRVVDVLDDTQAYAEAMTAIYEDMWADVAFNNGVTTTKHIEEAMLHVENKYGPDGSTLEHVQLSPMQPEEYDQLIEDPIRFVNEVILPRKYPELYADPAYAREALKTYAQENFHLYVELTGAVEQMCAEKYGITSVLNLAERIETPLDIIFDYFRGFSGTLTDLRRYKAKIPQALDSIWKAWCEPIQNTPYTASFPYSWQPPHIPCYLSPKQFDEYYWVHEKPMIERYIANGGKHYFLMEGKFEKLWDHFRELPKDSLILHVDDDDIIKAKKEIGDYQIIVGGLKMTDVRMKPFDQIKDDIKRVIDECAPGGGFIFSTDKAWIAPGDANKTLVEAFNFAHEYSSQH